jgi:hypothetical protein
MTSFTQLIFFFFFFFFFFTCLHERMGIRTNNIGFITRDPSQLNYLLETIPLYSDYKEMNPLHSIKAK